MVDLTRLEKVIQLSFAGFPSYIGTTPHCMYTILHFVSGAINVLIS